MSHRQETLVGFSGWIVIGKGKKRRWRKQNRRHLCDEGISLGASLAFSCTRRGASQDQLAYTGAIGGFIKGVSALLPTHKSKNHGIS